MVPKILIIAGSDPSGGAGIQADIKTATAHKIYSAAAITCLTAQNTKKVFDVSYAPTDFLRQQIEVVLDDISFDAVKIGMLGTAEIIDCVADVLAKKAKKIPLILDTVMVATSGDLLLKQNAVAALKSKLVKGAYIVTPNIDEAKVLAEMPIRNLAEMKLAATAIKALGAKNVLIKGGHLNFSDGKIHSILLDEKNNFHRISNKKIGNKNLHGTGCTLATAIACNVAQKMELLAAVKKANSYVYASIKKSLKVGKGSLVLGHF
ncbi:MAG: bifunctional hydroxymethylpyrimidine kinase/phosphomethylpyrimidine kinase [Rickettsiales bacterium]|nr:bifunctional hydroxymethylpyrimidine kinase/phosphomethylpyrimidine kinase [Rickettsiales bacterium]